ncbi:GCN5-related N-acetyltransferase protein (plasmid) [Rhizobium gallicum]|uniref:GCN5-related N-acetyltransferase protein n=1 Tax=Rhizobium gallicum TaxID=56730 RepID=A0A1L5NQV5_9HYPH|nr:GNAT family protein [Rhizobium gallicum]APO70290.1 GCN5-related N-acetyltransferase protein [Rhizobium gallicum]
MKAATFEMIDPFLRAPGAIRGDTVLLEPLNEGHEEELRSAAADERIWQFLGANGATALGFRDWFVRMIAETVSRQRQVYVLRTIGAGKIVGAFGFKDIDVFEGRVTVGSTWLSPHAWGTNVNAEATYLLLKQLYEDLRVNRCEYFVHTENVKMLGFLDRIGFVREGVLRSRFRLRGGEICDLVVASCLGEDWPIVKKRLQSRMDRKGFHLVVPNSACIANDRVRRQQI